MAELLYLRVRPLLIVLLAILPGLGVAIYSGLEERQMAINHAQAQALSLARQIAYLQGDLIDTTQPDWLERLANTLQLPPGSTLTVVDQRGTVLARYPDRQQWVGKSIADLPVMREILGQMGEGIAESVGADSVDYLYGFVPFRSAQVAGYAYVAVPRAEALARADTALVRNLVAWGVVAALAIAWFLASHAVRSYVHRLLATARQLAAGNLAARTGLSHERNELGQLAAALDHLAEVLEQRHAELQRALAEREQLFQVEREQRMLADALRQAAVAMNSTLDYDEVLGVILEQMKLVLPHDSANIMLIQGDTVRPLRWHGYAGFGAEDYIASVIFNLAEVPNLRHMCDSGQPVAIPYVENYPDWLPIPQVAWIKSWIGAPIRVRDQVIGFVNVDSCVPGFFSQADAERLLAFADQAAIAIHNARLYEQVKQELAERKRAEQEKEKLQAHLAQVQKMEAIGRLTAGIAHDFNNLLTAINGFAELLQMQLPGDHPAQEMAGKILASGRRAADLVRQLLAFARKQVILPVPLDLNAVISDLEPMLRRTLGEDIELSMQLAPDLWSVKADRAQIEQVIINLAVNARDAMPNGGQLTIQTANAVLDQRFIASHTGASVGEHVLLTIRDTGTGMSPEVQAHLFEPFFTTKQLGRGTGLGLATVYGIVKQSGGSIWVESQEGQGTTFQIYLPRSSEEAPKLIADTAALEELSVGGETILIVEDDAHVRELARTALLEWRYQVLEAADGKAAMQLVAGWEKPIHLLVTDVVMPGMSGKQLADQLREQCPGLKVLFMSGYTDTALMQREVLQAGANFIQKPFSPAELVSKVQVLLGN